MSKPNLKKFLNDLCRVAGHDVIDYSSTCTRCGHIAFDYVSLNGKYLIRGKDYRESGKTIIFTTPPKLHDHITIGIYAPDRAKANASFIGDGVRKGFKLRM